MSLTPRRLSPALAGRLNRALDLGVVAAALALVSPADPAARLEPFSLAVAGAALLTWALAARVLHLYDLDLPRAAADEAALVGVGVLAVSAVLALLALVAPETASLPSAGRAGLLLGPALVGVRLLVVRPLTVRDALPRDVLLVGTGPLARATSDALRQAGSARVVGFVELNGEQPSGELGAPTLGDASQLGRILATCPADEVIIAAHAARHAREIEGAVRTCETLGVPFALPALPVRMHRARLARPDAAPDGYIHFAPYEVKPLQRALKRLMDIVFSALALVALSPLLLVAALLIKATSRGPVLFRQVRVGLHGHPFHMLKLRSMVVDAERQQRMLAGRNEQTGPVFKMRHDPRVTPVGRVLRKYSIDELPQLVNVLRGDMSLVGPRPPLPSEVARYEPWQRRRLSVRPGLTCHWQVSGRNGVGFEEWMYLDMRYIDHWSLRTDLELILRTVPVVLTGRGAS